MYSTVGINNWDISALKDFRIGERQLLAFRGEFVNAFNHAQFLNPTSDIAPVNFGRVLTERGARVIQFALGTNSERSERRVRV